MSNSTGTQRRVESIADVLRRQSEHKPNHTAFRILSESNIAEREITYGELDAQASRIALALQEIAPPGSRALLLFPTGIDFIAAFFGCLYAGFIAVPADLPRRKTRFGRLKSIAEDCSPQVLLSVSDALIELQEQAAEELWLRGVTPLAVDRLPDVSMEPARQADTSDRLAFLQYTSGSTASPKGVMVSHANIVATLTDIDRGLLHDDESVFVTWLPTFHDLGLVYATLMPVFRGFPCYAMAPASFLRSPIRWLDAISRFGATHTAAPNFAYDLCVKKITEEQAATLDLHSWRVAVNGAEPVDARILRAFSRKFRSSGFDERAFCPAYGLAENTLKLAVVRAVEPVCYLSVETGALLRRQVRIAPEGSPGSQILVGCGCGEIAANIVIVDPDSLQTCDSDQVGEIWVKGDAVAQGYWNNEEKTRDTFHAYLPESGDGPFLRTGDLGFLHAGELFIVGRIKDVIILRGLNYYPQDIEATIAAAHPQVSAGQGAAFGVYRDGSERLIVVQETARSEFRKLRNDEIIASIRRAIWDTHQVSVDAIVLLKPGTIPRTSSGKIRRDACRQYFLDRQLEAVYEWGSTFDDTVMPEAPDKIAAEPATERLMTAAEIELWAMDWVKRRVPAQDTSFTPETPFADLGMDSVLAVEFTSELRKLCRERAVISDTLLWECPTIREASRYTAGEVRPELRRDDDRSRQEENLVNLSAEELRFLLERELNSCREEPRAGTNAC